MKSFDDVITITYLWRHLLFSVTFRWKIKTSPIFLKFSVGGKIEMLITKMGWDWQLTMVLVEKLQFPTDFSQKFNKHSLTIVLPWQHLSVRLDLCVFKLKAYNIILKVRKFQLRT